MKVALAQTNIIWEDKQSNIKKANELIKEAKENQAEMICFPEMSFTGFSMNIDDTAETDFSTVNQIKNIAKNRKICIGFGWVKRVGTKAENHYTVIDESGECLSDYVKIHPFSYSGEDQYFESGNGVYVFEYKGIIFSTLICYDLRFPEIFQVASAKADVLIVPANWPEKREDHWRTLLKARAIENQAYVLGINCAGNIGGLMYSGCSSAYSPLGEKMGEICNKEDMLFVELMDSCSHIREGFPVKQDRKWEFYRNMYQEF